MANDGRVAGNRQPDVTRHEATRAEAGKRNTDLTKEVSELRTALARVERQQERQQQRLLEGIQKESSGKRKDREGTRLRKARGNKKRPPESSKHVRNEKQRNGIGRKEKSRKD